MVDTHFLSCFSLQDSKFILHSKKGNYTTLQSEQVNHLDIYYSCEKKYDLLSSSGNIYPESYHRSSKFCNSTLELNLKTSNLQSVILNSAAKVYLENSTISFLHSAYDTELHLSGDSFVQDIINATICHLSGVQAHGYMQLYAVTFKENITLEGVHLPEVSEGEQKRRQTFFSFLFHDALINWKCWYLRQRKCAWVSHIFLMHLLLLHRGEQLVFHNG